MSRSSSGGAAALERQAIHLVCIDVDGTLIGASGAVRPEVWEAVRGARESGLRLALCSGRPAFGMTRALAARLDPGGWHVFQNGASVVHLDGGESRSERLDPEVVAELVSRSRETGRTLELYTDADYAVVSDGRRAREHAALLGVSYPRPEPRSLAGPIVRAQWLAAPGEVDALVGEWEGVLTVTRGASPVMPDTVFVNVTPPGVDKGSGVRAVAAAYGFPLATVMMVGDAENDVGAMRAVGYPVAMGNSGPVVRAAARVTVADVERGGLIEALALARASLRERDRSGG